METHPLVTHPWLKPSCGLERLPDALTIRNGPFKLTLPARADADVALERIRNEAGDRDAVASALCELTGKDPAAVQLLITDLVKGGVLLQHPNAEDRWFAADYIAYRLVDTYRTTLPAQLQATALSETLSAPDGRTVAVGLLLETYYFVRTAAWTSGSVLGRPMTDVQRRLLDAFFIEERDHAEAMAPAFRQLGLDEDEVRRGVASVENRLYQNVFYACGHRSAAHFAAALIVPEVPQHPAGTHGPTTDVLDMAQRLHGIPDGVARVFREHAAMDLTEDHGALPIRVISAEQAIGRNTATDLFRALRLAQDAYVLYLAGIVRHYRHWDGRPATAPAHQF